MDTGDEGNRLARARRALAHAEELAGLRPEARALADALARPPRHDENLPQLPGPTPTGAAGRVLEVTGGTGTLLRAAASLGGSGTWWGIVAVPDIGWLAASRAGIDLDRVIAVPRPGPRIGEVVALLLDGVEVLCLGDVDVPGAQRRRLAARLRRDGGTLLVRHPWPGVSRPWVLQPLHHLEAV